MSEMTFQLKDGFLVHKFLLNMNGAVDLVFSTDKNEETYLLLNTQEFGTITKSEIEKLKANQKIAIINNDTLKMNTFNIKEEDILTALLGM